MVNNLKQGARANRAGKGLEDAVEICVKQYGFEPIFYREWINSKVGTSERGVLLKNVPYTNVYGGSSRGEFLLSGAGIKDTRIECRLQNVSGSVDEKFPYLFENAKAFEERDVILVVEGDGYKRGAKSWLRSQAASIKYKDIKVLSLTEFTEWAEENLS